MARCRFGGGEAQKGTKRHNVGTIRPAGHNRGLRGREEKVEGEGGESCSNLKNQLLPNLLHHLFISAAVKFIWL